MKLATRVFLAASGAGIIGVLGVPLALYPKQWSKVAGWARPPDSPLEDYFARSLGAIGLALGATCIAASCAKEKPTSLLLLLTTIGAGAAVVHAIGAARGTYPPREAAEVPVLAAWSLWAARELVR